MSPIELAVLPLEETPALAACLNSLMEDEMST